MSEEGGASEKEEEREREELTKDACRWLREGEEKRTCTGPFFSCLLPLLNPRNVQHSSAISVA